LIASTGGLYDGYSEGYREGFVTKISHKGLIWKTWEGQMQVGVGELAALQEPFKFSMRDTEVIKLVQSLAGDQRVKLHYTEWLIMPFKIGDSGYEIVKVEKITD
jgi:hypothetical protein